MSRCRWMTQGGVRFHVPGCWGTVHDPYGICNCPRTEKTTEDRIDALEAAVERLISRLEKPQ